MDTAIGAARRRPGSGGLSAAVWVLGLRSLRDDVDTRLALTRAELRQMAGSGADPVTDRALTGPAQVVLAHLKRSNLPPFDSELGIIDGRTRWVSAHFGI